MCQLETTIQNAQKITLGQVDNGTLATVVTCEESIAITRHGRVESYLVPKHVLDEALMKIAVLECDNKRLLAERVAEPLTVAPYGVEAFRGVDKSAIKRVLSESMKHPAPKTSKHAHKSEMRVVYETRK